MDFFSRPSWKRSAKRGGPWWTLAGILLLISIIVTLLTRTGPRQ